MVMAMAEAEAEAEALALAAQGPDEAPLDESAIRSRVEHFFLEQRRLGGGEEEEEQQAEVPDVEVVLAAYKVAREAMDELDSTTAAASVDDFEAYLEQLRKGEAMGEERRQKLSEEISVTAETLFSDRIQFGVGFEMLESLFSNLGTKDLNHFDESSVLALRDYRYELWELDRQIVKSTMELEVLQHQQRDDEMFQLESLFLPFGAKVLNFKDNCLKMFLKAPILTSDCEIYGHKFNCPVDSFISDHELLIEIDKRNMEPKKVQIIPDDISVELLIERMESSREAISYPTLQWLIQQCQHQSIINALRRSLVNDANNSRHSFEYFNKEEMIVAHLDRGIDVSIKISSDWPLCSYGLKLISVCNSGDRPTNIPSTLLSKTKDLANELELNIRQHLLTFVDAVEDILIRELKSYMPKNDR